MNTLEKVFEYYLKNTNSSKMIDETRNNILIQLKPLYDGKSITDAMIKKCFKLIDNLYFNKTIQEKIDQQKYKIEFKVSGKLTSSAGVFKNRGKKLKILLSSPILDNLFNDDVKHVEINGIMCDSLLIVFIVLMEHEMTHCLLFLLESHPLNIKKEKSGHTDVFKLITYDMFKHTRITHNLLYGDIIKFHEHTKIAKEKFNIGDIVNCKGDNEGMLVLMSKTHGNIKTHSGKYKGCLLKDMVLIEKSKNKTMLEDAKKQIQVGKVMDLTINNKTYKFEILNKASMSFKAKIVGSHKTLNIKYWVLL
ncbi:MAG: SprT-like protein [Edafosvirus sp.]|uniref:SprT-like protein n=1 Tax=Edafosvirus sp. TaxID=2487765 RepID=A0A3G4ZTY1_9VIRU|nr:MAG: SprT-like protein [Edafosvirus sp.]